MAERNAFRGFPRIALALLRCPIDGGALEIASRSEFVISGIVLCTRCAHSAQIEEGILDLLDLGSMHETSRQEREQREVQSARAPMTVTDLDLAEIEPHLEALRLEDDHYVLEFGCGSGRYTAFLVERCRLVVAVDMTRGSLKALAQRLQPSNVALVRADVSRFAVCPGSFQAVLSTLTSNLPTASHRQALYRVAATALDERGSFVSGTHFHGVRDRLRGTAKDGYYKPGGIYRFCTTRRDVLPEITPYFQDVHLQPVQIVPPLGRTLHLPLLKVSRLCERIAGLREFANYLMTVGRKPIHQAETAARTEHEFHGLRSA